MHSIRTRNARFASKEMCPMQKQFTRRSFLKAGLLGSAAVACDLWVPRVATASRGANVCTLFDLRKCIACEACVEACRDINQAKFPVLEGPIPVKFPQSKVTIADWTSPEKREVRDRLTPFNWLMIQTATGTYKGREFELHVPRRCMHCHNAPCVNLCPFGVAFTQRNGIVRIHPDLCMGGGKCKAVCPWQIPERQSGVGSYLNMLPNFAGNGVMFKCDRCYNRVALGELPACIEACPKEVQTIGPKKEMVQRAHALAGETDGFIYGELESGGTNTIYVSPVPFDVLNGVITAGSGVPHLKPVSDPMAVVNRLGLALLAGPMIGAVIAAGRRKRMGNTADQPEREDAE
jgi:Fe-S-cluster-containing dehydrogenase component